MRILTLLALSAVSLTASAPAFAQNAMMKDGMHASPMAHMSAADTRRMASCNAMSHARMMRNSACARMMRAHPNMMHHNNAMQHGSAMQHDSAMSHDSMMKSGH